MRAYASAKTRMEQAKKDADALRTLKATSPLAALAHEIDMELVAEEINRRAQSGH